MLLVNTIKMVHVTVDCYVNLPEGIFLSVWVFACFGINASKQRDSVVHPETSEWTNTNTLNQTMYYRNTSPPAKNVSNWFSANAWCLIDKNKNNKPSASWILWISSQSMAGGWPLVGHSKKVPHRGKHSQALTSDSLDFKGAKPELPIFHPPKIRVKNLKKDQIHLMISWVFARFWWFLGPVIMGRSNEWPIQRSHPTKI